MNQKNSIAFIALFVVTIMTSSLYASETMIKWDPPTGEVTGYKICYGSSKGFYTEKLDVGNVTQYPLNNFPLNEGTTYYFVVKAYNNSGESGDSNEITYTKTVAGDTTPPLYPQEVFAEIYNGDIKLTWMPNSENDISGYNVYYGIASRDYRSPISVSGTECMISGLETGVLYYFAVTAVDTSANESGFSSPEVTKSIPPAEEGPILKWDAVAGDIKGYRICYGTSEGDCIKKIDVGNVTQYSLSNLSLTAGVKYYFAVTAYNASGESGNSNVVQHTISELLDTEAPSVSIELPTSGSFYETSSQSVDLSGSASDNTGVAEIVWTNSMGGSGTATGTEAWSATGIELTSGVNEITVTVKDAAGNEATDSITITSTLPVYRVGTKIQWDAVPGEVSGYKIRYGTSEENYTETINVGNVTEYPLTDLSLSYGTMYYFVVIAYNASGDSINSNVIAVSLEEPADTTAPSVSISSPTTDTTFDSLSSTIVIGGGASDNTGVTLVVWSNSTGGSGSATGTDSWSTSEISLAEGGNVITITVRDAAGNESTDVLTVNYTVPDTTVPSVVIASPTSGTSYDTSSSSIDISGGASDDTGVAQVLWSNSAGGNGSATGTDSWSIADISLAEGSNVITITARDAAGNESTDVLTVVYTPVDTEAPSLTLNRPTTGNYYFTRSGSVTFAGTASDNIDVKQITWSNSKGGSGVAQGTTNWSISDVGLVRWWNTITITAFDSAGNEKSIELTVVFY